LAPSVAIAAEKPGPIVRALRSLQAAQNRDGGFGRRAGDPSDPKTSVWATLAMVSLGIHPADQPRTNSSAFEYLVGDGKPGSDGIQGKLQDSSDLAAFMLVMQAIGVPDLGVGAGNELKKRQDRGGGGIPERKGTPPTTQATALATLAFLGDRVNSGSAQDTARWLKTAASGKGWGATSGAAPRPGTTGMAVTALMAVDSADIRNSRAQSYLLSAVNDDGGFGGTRPTPSEPVATAWAMLGLRAVGNKPRDVRGGTGISTATYLARQQNDEDGGFGDTLATAQILPGFNASGLTVEKPLVRGKSNRVSRNAGAVDRENGAGPGGDNDGQPGEGSKVDPNGDEDGTPDGNPSGDEPTGDQSTGDDPTDDAPPAPGDGGTPTADIPSSPAPATPAPSTPTPTPAPTPTPPKPADDTVASAGGDGKDEDDETAADAATKQVNGVVVGARAAAASSPPGLDAGGGDAGDRGAAVLGGLIVALVLVGTQLERRRPKRIVS
jgi:hypothetical protein